MGALSSTTTIDAYVLPSNFIQVHILCGTPCLDIHPNSSGVHLVESSEEPIFTVDTILTHI